MSGELASFDFAEHTRSAEGSETLSEETAPGGSTVSGVTADGQQQLSASKPAGAAGRSLATGRFTASLPVDAVSTSIPALENNRKELREAKMAMTKGLRHEERPKKKLRSRAHQLTDKDLVQVLMFRKSLKTKHEENMWRAASAGGA